MSAHIKVLTRSSAVDTVLVQIALAPTTAPATMVTLEMGTIVFPSTSASPRTLLWANCWLYQMTLMCISSAD